MRYGRLVVLAALLLTAAPQAQEPARPAPEQQLARAIYKELVETNTADSTGSVTRAATRLARRFRVAGFPAADVRLLVPPGKPTKGNLVVRYRGAGRGKPLLLLAHLDVVSALRSDWSIDPFTLTERDGYFWGRGTLDDKAMAAIFAANLIRERRSGWRPERDLILALTADEEGGDANGVEWLLAEHRALLDAAFAINEGGGGALADGRPSANRVQAAEKIPVNLTLTVTDVGGHSSIPRPDNAIVRLAAGLVKLSAYRFPIRLNEVSRAFFERSAPLESPDVGLAMRAILSNPSDHAADSVLSSVPRFNAVLRTTCTATRIGGGHAYNALPQLASANVNCRIIPGETLEEVRDSLARVLGDSAIRMSLTVPVQETFDASPSPLSDDVMGAISETTREVFGDSVRIVPFMSTGATDGRFLRAAGIPTYGVSGIFSDPADVRTHGRDERLLVKSFYEGQEFLYRLVRRLADPPSERGVGRNS